MFKLASNTAEKIDSVNPFTTTIPKLEAVTEKYKFISTAQFIEDVQSFGYKLEETKQPRRGLGMHSMSFSHPALPKSEGLGMRLLATNSHDGTSAFRLYVQILVQVCSNGLVAWRSEADKDARVVHRGYALDKVGNALDKVNSKFGEALDTINTMKDLDASPERTAEFLLQAVKLRDARPFKVTSLINVRFAEQSQPTVWNVFNNVQYHLINGGYNIEQFFNGKAYAGQKAKELTAVKERVRVNTQLWQLAVKTYLKGAK